jgi:uncharacterized protein (DUF302 family)
MEATSYGFVRELPDVDYEEAIARATEALGSEGFGVLTEIDVKATLKKKIDVEFDRYVILGACNPPLAHRALQADRYMGLLLPCNVVVMEREGGGSVVAAIKPSEMFKVVDDPDIQPIADEVEEKLIRVMERL